ncbi:MAG TPA: glycosyltransferase, partial [Terriglobales bacterium]|nr:glycosyltransferase [Terriglobales bacterium]
MRILLSAYACRPNAGSEPGYGWNWATHLAARGIEVHVLANHRNQALIENTLRESPTPNLRFTFLRVPSRFAAKSEGLHYIWWQWIALSATSRLHEEQAFDLVHHVTYGSVHVPSQLWRLGIPVVFGPVGGGQTAPSKMLSYFGAHKMSERIRTML